MSRFGEKLVKYRGLPKAKLSSQLAVLRLLFRYVDGLASADSPKTHPFLTFW
jgi:hypothetical protein